METVLKNDCSHCQESVILRENGSAGRSSNTGIQHDIICVGFGPAALAIAIAMRDRGIQRRVRFLERQPEFGWHTGMLLPGSKMQISFIKDLATIRNPRSHFTFLNYLHQKDRLVHFTNLSTHLPFREEFNDYMKWCASHFNDWVQYNQEVLSVTAVESTPGRPAEYFKLISRDVRSGELRELSANHIIVASGGEPAIPPILSTQHLPKTVIHSSTYLGSVHHLLQERNGSYRFAVVGGGQSAVEISEDIQSRYANSKVTLVTKASALKPSDDSPFVNEIFDPSSVDKFYSLDHSARQQTLLENKATNYGVVRLPLLESVYEKLYRQKFLEPNPAKWPFRLVTGREVMGLKELPNNQIELQLKDTLSGRVESSAEVYDLVILATGYTRNPIATMLKPLEQIVEAPADGKTYCTDRDYRLRFRQGKVKRDAGIWLQGCCESSHGLSDSLLSILAVRSSELLDSILASSKRAEDHARL
ncbi:L-ornithine 5-monooxygenase [Histoplasma capsulatum G186AR]|uniref:L-ornithine N(5)-monooxygenase n=2 Tax=Ajellomyces capsulatus TaxID=5037 RepID=C0P0V9_AJECG|nr:L-ornithine 5-monooxygenase [Histoplasma capsulatum G186AR]EEH02759.1 L-ornithine 5-monooxygenase [Histoplasma capsulatum G186AR]KAG5287329.1 L-ornithine 5-monooxygenase [Histoplasma capsulatum]QSS70860.1 L-ornithine 5-monooxygenase [Histoplasma capsulatum G186AR]